MTTKVVPATEIWATEPDKDGFVMAMAFGDGWQVPAYRYVLAAATVQPVAWIAPSELAWLAERRSEGKEVWVAATSTPRPDLVAVYAAPAVEGERQDGARAVLQALVDKLHLIHADDRYKSVWTMYQLHGGWYSGPTYQTELREAEAYLAASPAGERQEPVAWMYESKHSWSGPRTERKTVFALNRWGNIPAGYDETPLYASPVEPSAPPPDYRVRDAATGELAAQEQPAQDDARKLILLYDAGTRAPEWSQRARDALDMLCSARDVQDANLANVRNDFRECAKRAEDQQGELERARALLKSWQRGYETQTIASDLHAVTRKYLAAKPQGKT